MEVQQGGLDQGVLHRRRLVYLPPDRWAVADDFTGPGCHTIDLYFHFASNVELGDAQFGGTRERAELSGRAGDARFLLSLRATHPFTTEVLLGQTDPIQGWVSYRYGSKEPAPVLRARYQGATPVTFLSLVLPARAGSDAAEIPRHLEARAVEPSGVEALACALEREGRTDLLILSAADREVTSGRYRLRGEFFWLREEDGLPRQILAVNARSVRVDTSWVFCNSDPIAHVSARFDRSGMEIERADTKERLHVRDLRDREFEFR